MDNTLYYGDNLDVLKLHIKDESVDLIYLDPPFNSKATYNVLFEDHAGEKSSAQLEAFKDTWSWEEAALTFQELCLDTSPMGDAIRSFGTLLGKGGMLAYLTMMAPRLQELHRVLKPTGSIYLHCDPTASHYLKIMMDAIFGAQNFRNEIVWKRTSSHNDSRKWPHIHDTILFYAGKGFTWNPIFLGHDPTYVDNFYRFSDERGKYRLHEIIRTASMGPRPNLAYEYKGYTPQWGWRMIREKVETLDKDGRITWSGSGRPYLKRYLEEQQGTLASSIWVDIPPLSAAAAERLGYPTQKPEALLERIIKASSNEGDTVLDPFCGCGTATVVSQRLNRKWIGIDVTQAAIQTIKKRLKDAFGDKLDYKVIGEPVSVYDAHQLADDDPYQFQWWSLGLVGARPIEKKKGADSGIDGRLFFNDEPGQPAKQIIISVKAGNTNVAHVRDLRGVVLREKAAIGVLLIMHDITAPMKAEAGSAGHYVSPWGNHPKIQIITIKELLEGKMIDYPKTAGVNITYKKAPKSTGDTYVTKDLLDTAS